MDMVNPAQVQEYLSAMPYPARRDELVAHAAGNGADESTLALLRELPDRSFAAPTDVSLAIGEIERRRGSRAVMAPTAVEYPPPTPTGQASRTATKAQDFAKTQLNSQKGKVAEVLQSTGGAIRQASQALREEGQSGLSEYADQGAQRVESLSDYVRRTDADELLTKAQETARRQPLAIAGAGFALAFLAARFLRSSGQKAQPGQSTAGGAAPPQDGDQQAAALVEESPTPRRRRARLTTEATA